MGGQWSNCSSRVAPGSGIQVDQEREEPRGMFCPVHSTVYLAQFVGLKIYLPLVWVSSSMITYPANISSFRLVKVMVMSLRQSLLEWDEN